MERSNHRDSDNRLYALGTVRMILPPQRQLLNATGSICFKNFLRNSLDLTKIRIATMSARISRTTRPETDNGSDSPSRVPAEAPPTNQRWRGLSLCIRCSIDWGIGCRLGASAGHASASFSSWWTKSECRQCSIL